MNIKAFPLLGLILAILVGPRAMNRGPEWTVPAQHSPAGVETTRPQKDGQKAAHAVEVVTTDCSGITLADLKQRWWLARSANGCSVMVSPVWREICKINPKVYNEEEALAANLTADDFKKKCLGDPALVQSMMAAVPNPRRTHMGLMTDRAIEAIQVAASEARFMPLAHYLPWPAPNAGGVDGVADGDRATEPTPGVLVFQNADSQLHARPKYLLVFLIPETPTEGLDRIVFKKVGEMIKNISPLEKNTIRLVGPNFSGSVEALEEIQTALGGKDGPIIDAVSGSVTNQESLSKPFVKFTRLQTSDGEALCRFVRGAKAFGYQSDEIAILSEEGTQYGRQGPTEDDPASPAEVDTHSHLRNTASIDGRKHPCTEEESEQDAWDHLWFLHFPREISTLRNAYGEVVGKTAPASSSAAPDLGLQWQDTEVSHSDDILMYGGLQTPLSQEAVLSTLSITLKAQGIKALGILATDPMDEAFLIHSIKRSSPDVRLFVRDPDLLFLRTPDVGSLNGTLLISNYPLVPQNQFWTPTVAETEPENAATHTSGDLSANVHNSKDASRKSKEEHHLISFPSAFQEGEYNAFVELLDHAGWATPDMQHLEWDWPTGMSADVRSNQAGQPSDAGRPLWLAVIGTAGHFPVKVLNADETNRAKLALHSLDLGRPQFSPLIFWVAIAALGLLHVLGLKFYKAVPTMFKQDFDLTDKTSTVTLVKHFCHMMATLTIALAQLILGSSYLFFYGSGSRYTVSACAVIGVTVILLIAAGIQFRKIRVLSGQQKKLSNPPEANKIITPRRILSSSFVFGFIMVAAGVFWIWATMGNRFSNAFLHFRNLNLSSGVAPTLPLASLLLVLYFGIWAYLRRLSYWQHRYVDMFDLELDPVICQDFKPDFRAIDACLLGPLENRRWMIGALFVAVLSFVIFRPVTTLDMIEPSSVAKFALLFFGLALMSLWVNWFRFLNVWMRLRNILDRLENLPLRTAFERLPRAKTLPILQWSSSQNIFLLRQVLDRVRALAKADPSNVNQKLEENFEARIKALSSSVAVTMSVVEKRVVGGSPWTGPQSVPSRRREDHLREARQEMTAMMKTLSKKLRDEYWNRGSSCDSMNQKTDPADLKYVLAEDIVALPFYAYIRKVMLELRNILFFLGVAVSLLFAALHTYAFRADQAIDWWFFGLFAVMGFGIVVVIAQVERNALMSRLTDTTPGELGSNFYIQLLKYGTVPILTIFGSQIPFLSNVVLKWAQPALEALH